MNHTLGLLLEIRLLSMDHLLSSDTDHLAHWNIVSLSEHRLLFRHNVIVVWASNNYVPLHRQFLPLDATLLNRICNTLIPLVSDDTAVRLNPR